MNTFKHSGDIGDIIYSLPTVRALGGGVLYLDPTGGIDDEYIQKHTLDKKTKFSIEGINFLIPLLKIQPYLKDVRVWAGEEVTYNLNKFRENLNSVTNLCECHLKTFNYSVNEASNAWIFVDDAIKLKKPHIIARSPRYQGNHGFFYFNRPLVSDYGTFVGLPKEHEYFEWTFGISVDYFPTEDALHLAKVIKGCETILANGSVPMALAIGLGHKNIIQEVDRTAPSCVFSNLNNIRYV